MGPTRPGSRRPPSFTVISAGGGTGPNFGCRRRGPRWGKADGPIKRAGQPHRLLEGSLARKLGIPNARQRQVADEAISTFTRPGWREQHVMPRAAPTGTLSDLSMMSRTSGAKCRPPGHFRSRDANTSIGAHHGREYQVRTWHLTDLGEAVDNVRFWSLRTSPVWLRNS